MSMQNLKRIEHYLNRLTRVHLYKLRCKTYRLQETDNLIVLVREAAV